MPRRPEHPLHPVLVGWAEWLRAGGHDNQGWPGISPQAPERRLAETDTKGIASARRRYRSPEPPDEDGNPDTLKIPVPIQATPSQQHTACSKPPRQNPPPPITWVRITRILRRLQRSSETRPHAEAVVRYYVRREGPFNTDCRSGCDMINAALISWGLD